MSRGLLCGLGLGAGLAYFFDPERGRYRRSLLRDRVHHWERRLEIQLDKGYRDAVHRAQGIAAEVRTAVLEDEASVSDGILVERVRAKLGRYVSHPRAVFVDADDGHVTLAGQILADEVPDLLAAVRRVPGVHQVENLLEVYPEAGNVAALQGGITPPGERWNVFEDNWAPGTRLTAAVLGSSTLAYALTKQLPAASVLGLVGLGLCTAAIAPACEPTRCQPR